MAGDTRIEQVASGLEPHMLPLHQSPMAEPLRFELRNSASKAEVLPLDDGSKWSREAGIEHRFSRDMSPVR